MKVRQNFLPIEVKKTNELIRNKINISSVHGARIFTSLLSLIKEEDMYLVSSYTVNIKDLAPNGGESYKRIKDTSLELSNAKIVLEEELNDDDPMKRKYGIIYNLFTSIRFTEKGQITARFNNEIMHILKVIAENGNFTKYNLIEYMQLNSIYSQRIYEILKSYIYQKQGFIDLKLAHLHKILDTPESFKKDFSKFRVKVLDIAHKDILKKTSFIYSYETIKQGKGRTSPVIGIRFIFDKNKKSIPTSPITLPSTIKNSLTFEDIVKNIKSPMQEWEEEKKAKSKQKIRSL